MATPTQHRAAVTTYLARVANTGLTEPLSTERERAEIHAILSTKAGTGDEYTTADQLLSDAGDNRLKLHTAKVHAHLATPAA
jgi:hypothetical protein